MSETSPLISIPKEGAEGKGTEWLRRLSQSHLVRREEEAVWARNLRWENNEREIDLDTALNQDTVKINKVGAWLADRVPKVMFRRPSFLLTPNARAGFRLVESLATGTEAGTDQPVQIPAYKLTQAAMNFYAGLPMVGLRQNLRRAIHGGYTGFGIIKTGYSPHLIRDSDNVKKAEEDDGLMRDSLGQVILDDSGDPIRTGTDLQDSWFMDFVPWWRMLMDPDGGVDLKNHGFIACEYLMELEALKKNPRYKNTGDLGGGDMLPLFVSTANDFSPNDESILYGAREALPYEDNKMRYVRAFEIFDLRERKLITVVDGHHQPIEEIDTPAGIYGGHPYSILRFHERPWQFYQRTEVDDLVHLNQEWEIFRTQLLRWVRRTNRKYIARRGALGPTELEKLTSTEDMAVALTDRDLDDDIIREIPVSGISGDFFGYGNMILRDIDEVGRTPASTSRNAGAAQSATAVSVAEQHHGVGIEDDRETVAEFISDIGMKLMHSMAQNMTGQQMIQITGDQGAEYALEVTRDQIYSNCYVRVNANEMAPRNSDVAMKQFTEFMKTTVQSPAVLMSEKFVRVMADLYGIYDEGFVEAAREVGMIFMQQMGTAAQPGAGGPVPGSQADLRAIQGGAGQM